MSFVTANFERKAPEANIADPVSVRDLYIRMMRLKVPGFVMRQVSADPDEAHTKLECALEGAVLLGTRYQRLHFPHGPEDKPDRGFHIDSGSGDFPSILEVNETSVQKGRLQVELFSLIEPFATNRFHGSEDVGIDDEDTEIYEEYGQVDNTYVDPSGYRYILEPGDILVFADIQNPHNFVTLEPRESIGDLYHPTLITA